MAHLFPGREVEASAAGSSASIRPRVRVRNEETPVCDSPQPPQERGHLQRRLCRGARGKCHRPCFSVNPVSSTFQFLEFLKLPSCPKLMAALSYFLPLTCGRVFKYHISVVSKGLRWEGAWPRVSCHLDPISYPRDGRGLCVLTGVTTWRHHGGRERVLTVGFQGLGVPRST